jgi:DNA-binding NarL/FixJ family response regulator
LIRVLHCDDSTAYRRLVAVLLGEAGDIEMVGEADDCHALMTALGDSRPDVLLLDLVPGLSPARLAEAAPGVRVVLHTGHPPEAADPQLLALAAAHVPKCSDVDELRTALRAACLRP